MFTRSETPSDWQVRLGDYVTTARDSAEFDSTVGEVFVHPEFNFSRHGNDIALVRMGTPRHGVTLTPVCLPEKCLDPVTDGHDCYVTGWGQTRGERHDDTDSDNQYSDVLR